MPQPDPNLPDSIILGQFSGLKNTVTSERLSPQDLEQAVNVDIDATGQVRRRRGYTQKLDGGWHSVKDVSSKVYGVRDGILGIVRPDYSFVTLYGAGSDPLTYTEVAGDVYFSSRSVSGKITEEEVHPWGATDGQGAWLSPVYTPTDTLGAVGGTLLGDPPKATCITAYKGRIYLAAKNVLWATELYRYNYVDRTKNFMQFEHDITLLLSMDDGLYVGTTAGLYFIQGVMGAFKLHALMPDAVLPGSGVYLPVDLINPQARSQVMPTGVAGLVLTSGGAVACFDGGNIYNLTHEKVIFPDAFSAAALFRQDSGDNSYVVAMDSTGGPSANTRIGDFADATIVRKADRGHGKAPKTSVISVTVAEGIGITRELLDEVVIAGVPQGATYDVTVTESVGVNDA